MADLLPCPFCGFRDEASHDPPKPGLREMFIEDLDGSEMWWVECDNCFARGQYERDSPTARRNWNRRQPYLPPEDVERLKAISLTMEMGTPGEPDTGEDYANECRALRAIIARLEGK